MRARSLLRKDVCGAIPKKGEGSRAPDVAPLDGRVFAALSDSAATTTLLSNLNRTVPRPFT
jgi:hypothetical protein